MLRPAILACLALRLLRQSLASFAGVLLPAARIALPWLPAALALAPTSGDHLLLRWSNKDCSVDLPDATSATVTRKRGRTREVFTPPF